MVEIKSKPYPQWSGRSRGPTCLSKNGGFILRGNWCSFAGRRAWILGAASLLLLPTVASADATRDEGQQFTIQPVADGVVIAAGAGFSTLLGLVLSTGEITPQVPGSPSLLLGLDRIAVTQTIDPKAGTISDLGLYGGIGLAVVDSLSTGFRDRWQAAAVDAVMYSESISVTLAFDDLVKIAVRRPRPIDYIKCAGSPKGTASTSAGCNSTDLGLSFFSGHESVLAAISGTATYLAFIHSPDSPRPWLTLTAGTLLTAFVGYERVRAGAHFPTDVMMGALAGASVGVLVPQLHRGGTRSVWIDFTPAPGNAGGSLSVAGTF